MKLVVVTLSRKDPYVLVRRTSWAAFVTLANLCFGTCNVIMSRVVLIVNATGLEPLEGWELVTPWMVNVLAKPMSTEIELAMNVKMASLV